MSARDSSRAVLHIDWTRCEARGACIELLENRLTADSDGFPLALGQSAAGRTDVPLATADLPAARDAVAACPRLAVHLDVRRR